MRIFRTKPFLNLSLVVSPPVCYVCIPVEQVHYGAGTLLVDADIKQRTIFTPNKRPGEYSVDAYHPHNVPSNQPTGRYV